MAATFVDITELEMDSLLKKEKGWEKNFVGREYVYVYRTKKNPDVVVKVYSSITSQGINKNVGKDAIRVCAVNTKTNKGIFKSKRVNRTQNWEVRVKERVIELLEKIK